MKMIQICFMCSGSLYVPHDCPIRLSTNFTGTQQKVLMLMKWLLMMSLKVTLSPWKSTVCLIRTVDISFRPLLVKYSREN